MIHYLNRTAAPDLPPPEQYPDWNGQLPDIISFTDFLRWNYTLDYGRYIRGLHKQGQLPLCWDIPRTAAIETVVIANGKYDRFDRTTFQMYVICDVVFIVNGYRHCQKYLVYGYYKSGCQSDFLCDVELYSGRHIRCNNPLDECRMKF